MRVTKVILISAVIGCAIACTSNSPKQEKATSVTQSFQEHSTIAHHQIALEVIKASKDWINNFNNGNVEACVNGYTKEAILRTLPFGLKKGRKEISDFWTPFIKSGATNLIYTNPSVEVVDEKTALLSANWSMNVGRGVIYQEKWEKIDGKWLLTYDDFEVLEQFNSPQENKTNPTASHEMLVEVIEASIDWINEFNKQKADVCAKGYTINATMNAVPFVSANGQEEIHGFWEKLIADGAKNLTYHNPTFKVITDHTVLLSSSWSMNIGEGKIFQEKWVLKNGNWLLNYDEFKVLKQYNDR
ncbi:hypothetical protein [Xanthovirga aplysinae]|uniref:hypothetical protein n=1 Tax=Xanthovirga aplysinae TaxID=2529853 RepID=UPI0012BCC147|nr:hypothetical protein [Xanthovirga aplysinae]MTI30426.1 hypothetical protein [Xanthovirga aplysinae]